MIYKRVKKIIIIMLNNQEPEVNEQEVLNYYKQNYKTKICKEYLFEKSLDEAHKKLYEKFHKFSCCNTPLSLMIYSIFILVFTCAGFFFSISKNEGYKAYKGLLERNMSLIDTDLPNEYETIKLLYFLTTNTIDEYECDFFRYSEDLCTLEQYARYCTPERKAEEKCNYMDSQYHIGNYFQCTLYNYEAGLCNQIQYNYELERTGQIYYEHKIEYSSGKAKIRIKNFSLQKIWCKIGDYDQPIYLGFLILMIIFIALCIFDLALNKKAITPGVRYYLALSFYMIFHVIFRIFTPLFLILSGYGIFVSLLYPSTYSDPDDTTSYINDPFLDSSVIIIFPEEKLWKDKRLYALIFCGISFLLFILVWILSYYKQLIYNYLSFDFHEKIEGQNPVAISEIKRSASIKVGKTKYYFDIKQNKDIYLKENRAGKIHFFKEIVFKDNTYYLKYDNLGLKDQLAWNEFKYPFNNEVTYRLGLFLNLIYVFLYLFVALLIWNFKDDNIYDYFIRLLDSGYKPKNHKYIKRSNDLNSIFDDFIMIFYLIFGIISILAIAKWAFFGGFKNMIFIWISIIISIIITLLNLAVVILCIIGAVFNFLGLLAYSSREEFEFEIDTIFFKLLIHFIFYVYVFIFSLPEFIYSILMIISLNKIKNENQRLETEKKTSEDIFKYMALSNQNMILEAVNNNPELPKHLFYQRKIDNSPMIDLAQKFGQSSDIILCLEQNIEEILDDKKKVELQNYKYKAFDTKRIISKIILQIIFSGLSFIITIIAIVYSFNKNEYYKAYRVYFNEIDENFLTNISGFESLLPGYTKFWCDFGNYQNSIFVSFLIFVILYLLFEIFSLLIHKSVIKLAFQIGIFHNIIIWINMAFYFIFKVYFPLYLFLFIFSWYTLAKDPQKISSEDAYYGYYSNNSIDDALYNEWNDKKYIIAVSIACSLLLMIFDIIMINVKYTIIDYLNKNYEEIEDEEGNPKDEDLEKNEVTTSLTIRNNKYNATIKLNHILYLQQINTSGDEFLYKFKKVKIDNITNDFIYVRLGLNSITEQISLAQWNYPDLNHIFSRLADMCNSIYIILFFSVPLFKMHVKDDASYLAIKLANMLLDSSRGSDIKKPLFYKIFDMYGSYEKSFTESRFTLYIIQLIILLLFMLKRIYFGGFAKSLLLTISFILCIICLIDNIVYVILDFLTILFSLFSIISLYDTDYISLTGDMIEFKLFFQLIINIIIFSLNIKLLKETIAITSDCNILKKAMVKFNNNEDNIDLDKPDFKPVEFKYISLEGAICSIKEYRNNDLQRYLYYSSDNINGNNQENANPNIQVNHQENNQENLQGNIQPNNANTILEVKDTNDNKNTKTNFPPNQLSSTDGVVLYNRELETEKKLV